MLGWTFIVTYLLWGIFIFCLVAFNYTMRDSYRIIKSAYLLIYTKKSITDIAYETGFQDLSYYIKIFNKQMGVSPNNYRKNIATQTLKNL